jgi:excisionase family DNA binding protein
VQQATSKTEILTIREVAEVLRCSKAHVCNVLHGRVHGLPKLTHFALGRRELVRREWLETWMEQNKQQW